MPRPVIIVMFAALHGCGNFADPYVIKKLSTGEPALGVNFGWRFKSSTAHLE